MQNSPGRRLQGNGEKVIFGKQIYIMIFEYGIMSSKYSIEAENKLTAYAAMIMHLGPASTAFIAIYSPEESRKTDSWMLAYPIVKRLDEVFGGEGSFFKYLGKHQDEINKTLDTIEQLV